MQRFFRMKIQIKIMIMHAINTITTIIKMLKTIENLQKMRIRVELYSSEYLNEEERAYKMKIKLRSMMDIMMIMI